MRAMPFAHCEALVRAADKDRFLAACLRRPSIAAPCLRSMPSTSRSRACARSCASRWRAKSGCNGGAMCSAARAAARSRPIRWRRRCTRPSPATGCRSERLAALIEARRFDLYDEPMATLAELEAYAPRRLVQPDRAGGANSRRRPRAGIGVLAEHAGLAHAMAGLLGRFPSMPRAASCSCRSRCCSGMARTARISRAGRRRRSCAPRWPRCAAAPAVISRRRAS